MQHERRTKLALQQLPGQDSKLLQTQLLYLMHVLTMPMQCNGLTALPILKLDLMQNNLQARLCTALQPR